MTVEDKSKVDDLLANLRELESMYVTVGILSKAGGEMLMIANVHEFGCNIPVTNKMRGFLAANFDVHLRADTKVIKIPERSFVRSAYDNKASKIKASGEDLIAKVVEGSMSARVFYTLLGQTCADTIRQYLVAEVNSPPNSEMTIKAKGSSNPLVNTGQLAAAITYEIRSR